MQISTGDVEDRIAILRVDMIQDASDISRLFLFSVRSTAVLNFHIINTATAVPKLRPVLACRGSQFQLPEGDLEGSWLIGTSLLAIR